jgi:dolichyl-phosphate beta-glucosyltransferase
MSTNNYYLSICIPVFNEETIVLKKIVEIKSGIAKILGENKYEIIIVENGSTDNTLSDLLTIKDKNVKIITLKKKAHGLALKTGIQKAQGEYVLLTAIDFPFGFSDLEEMFKISNRYDIIFGSKAHPKSIIYSSLLRKISSKTYRLFLKMLFNIKIKDTQGTVFLKKASVIPILKNCNASNAFLTAQLAIFAERNKLIVYEVPVTMKKEILRKSRYNVFSNGGEMLITMFKTFLAINLSSPKS